MMTAQLRVWILALATSPAEPQRLHPGAEALSTADAPYPLDGIVRWLPAKGPMHCPKVPLVRYAGDVLPYASAVMVHPEFAKHLALFEAVIRDTAVEVYGRAPRSIRHLGTLNCRRIRTWPELLSEHGLGNGIDIAGFDLPALRKRDPAHATTPPALRGVLKIRLAQHWQVPEHAGEVANVHARFLHTLAARLTERRDIFRVLLGPAYPGHKDHFHFDCAPWRLVSI